MKGVLTSYNFPLSYFSLSFTRLLNKKVSIATSDKVDQTMKINFGELMETDSLKFPLTVDSRDYIFMESYRLQNELLSVKKVLRVGNPVITRSVSDRIKRGSFQSLNPNQKGDLNQKGSELTKGRKDAKDG